MSQTHVVVLGAGFAGLELTARLSARLGDDVRITLIDRSDAFIFGFAKLDVMFGRRTMSEVRLPYAGIDRSNVAFRQESVTSIDPERKRVVTDAGVYDADILVIAMGADIAPELTPGLLESGHEFYTPHGAARVGDLLEGFSGGEVVIGVLGGYFKCPPAPYETAFMLHDYLTRRGLREATSIRIVTPMPKPIPISDEVSDAIVALLDERNIGHSHSAWISELVPAEQQAAVKGMPAIPYDLFLAVPVHVAPPVVVAAGLTEDGWIPVDPGTFATRFDDVYAVGDITSAPVPRAGVIAEGEARTVADVIAHQLQGGPAPAPYAAEINCYIEMGAGAIGKVAVSFSSGQTPTSSFTPPSVEGAREKQQFASDRRQRWFGS
jgi:sulfide:quinone oxidoreductase